MHRALFLIELEYKNTYIYIYVYIDVMCLCANTAFLSQVTTVSCTDADIGDSLTYSISPANSDFSVDGSSGDVSTING